MSLRYPAAASEDWGHSPCRRQPASTQTRRQRQHHSKDYCEREVDEVELQGGRVYLHLGAPPRRAAAAIAGRSLAEVDPDQQLSATARRAKAKARWQANMLRGKLAKRGKAGQS